MKREDGRKPHELRPVEIKAGVLPRATGSALVKMGKTHALVAVYGPRSLHPRHLQLSDKALLQTNYTMMPFSTTERVRPGYSRRSIEISKVIKDALGPVVYAEEFPKATIDVYIDIIQADAGTRTAAINAASVALADAGVPMRDLVTAVAVGKIEDQFVVDLTGKEEEVTKCDMPIAYVPRGKKITLLQLDGDVSHEDFKELLKLATKACETIYEKQRQALIEKWSKRL